MRTKFFSFLLVGILSIMNALAVPVSQRVAKQQAQAFLTQRGISANIASVQKLSLPQAQQQSVKELYAFNLEREKGYVLVAGTRTESTVIGYSHKGSFSETEMPVHIKSFLQAYASVNAQRAATIMRALPRHNAIEPLVTTQWGQGQTNGTSAYNRDCPMYNGSYCITGCTATAMAQIMNYWQYPATLPALPSFVSNTSITCSALPAYSMTWSLKNKYANNDLSDPNISKLMRYCGQALKSNYGTGLTSAYTNDIGPAFQTFGYNSGIAMVSRLSFSINEWDSIIYNELNLHRPILYTGQSADGGHAFVCDGYDGNGFYHINWGWNGMSDGYFALALLDPDEQGAGGSASGSAYTNDQIAIIGIQTTTQPHPQNERLSIEDIILNGTSLKTTFYNITSNTNTFDYGWGILSNNGTITPLYTTNNTIDSYGGYYYTCTLRANNFPAGQTSKLVPISKLHSSSTWQICSYQFLPNFQYIAVTNNGSSITATIKEKTTNIHITAEVKPGVRLLNNNQYIHVKVNNLGEEVNMPLYMYVLDPSGTKRCWDGYKHDIYLATNDSVEFEYIFYPTSGTFGAGTYAPYIVTTEEGDIADALWYTTVNIAPQPSIDFDVTINSVTMTGGKTLKCIINATNNSSETYPYGFRIYLYKGKVNYNATTSYNEERIYPENFTAHSTQDFVIEFPITEDGSYSANCYSYQSRYSTGDYLKSPNFNFCAATIFDNGYCTYSKSYALDFTACDDLKAYSGTVYNDSVVLQEYTQIPANTGLVLQGTPNTTYAIPLGSGTYTTPQPNDLQAITAAQSVTPASVLTLANKGNVVGFQPNTETTLSAATAVLPAALTTLDFLPIHIDNECTFTPIPDPEPEPEPEPEYYTLSIVADQWYFLSFPFDIQRDTLIFKDADNVSRDFYLASYNGAKRAYQGYNAWEYCNQPTLQRGCGYIFASDYSGTLQIPMLDIDSLHNVTMTLQPYATFLPNNAGWNFIGNPYNANYNIQNFGTTSTITVWDTDHYEAQSAQDDNYLLKPFEAFFIQYAETTPALTFKANKTQKAKAESPQSLTTNRSLINLTLTGDGSTDRTRIVFNAEASNDYEPACDAAKFAPMDETLPQLYTLYDNVRYAINERPVGDVLLGYTVSAAGEYTISAKRMDVQVELIDNQTNTIHNFTNGDYTFTTDAGDHSARFILRIAEQTTNQENIACGTVALDRCKVYTVTGAYVGENIQHLPKGVYIIQTNNHIAKILVK